MQKRNQGNIPKRTRFYQALIDTPMLKSGERGFDNLKPAYIIVICGFDQYGYGKYRYTFENRCKEIPDLTMGDECTKIILNTKGTNDDEVEKSLVDFLHYVDHSSEENVPDDCDERLKHLHKKIYEIKSNEQMGVSYMKMEERDRLIRVLMLSLAVMIPLCHADMKLPGYLSWNVPFDGADNRPITEGISSYIHALPAL